ncbi:hypothetical protein CHISP_1908 [Chitinispirillum alkaliphilum]|nr:hypothetical protein CHISP_1908 [Chitinispirillum alkaliphilum]
MKIQNVISTLALTTSLIFAASPSPPAPEMSENEVKTEEVAVTEESAESAKTEEVAVTEESAENVETEEVAVTEEAAESAKTEEVATIEESAESAETEEVAVTEEAAESAETEEVATTEESAESAETEEVATTEESAENVETEEVATTEESAENVETEEVAVTEEYAESVETEEVAITEESAEEMEKSTQSQPEIIPASLSLKNTETNPTPSNSEESFSNIKVSRIAIAPVIENREPQNAGENFPVDIQNLYCFTHVVGAEDSTEVIHRWYYIDELRSVVTLPVNSTSWRTFSLVQIEPEQIGSWRVDVIQGEIENVIKTVKFEIE